MASIAEQVAGERMARMVLSMITGPDDVATGRVLAHAGGVETLRLIESDDPIEKLDRVTALLWRERLTSRLDPDLIEQAAQIERSGIGTRIPADDDWPVGLNDLEDRAPFVLWTRGATSLLNTPLCERVTITGSRAATTYGVQVTEDFAANLADDERVIVAGGAFGIEGAAHRAALAQGGHTVAVLACGVDRAYPAAHHRLLEEIGDVGLLVSELPPGAAPTRQRFLARGRLLATFSGATVIPEAAGRSGAMRVAAQAHALGRGVAAVPGPVKNMTSVGPHELIKRGVATIATTASDVTGVVDGGRKLEGDAAQSELWPEFTYRQTSSSGRRGRTLAD